MMDIYCTLQYVVSHSIIYEYMNRGLRSHEQKQNEDFTGEQGEHSSEFDFALPSFVLLPCADF